MVRFCVIRMLFLLSVQFSWIQSTTVTCSVTCGGGFVSRVEYCEYHIPFKNGANCYIEVIDVSCNTQPCSVNGNWGAWQNSSTCSVTYGVGHTTQVRACNNPAPAGNGSQCVGNSTRSVSCDTGKNRPINGNWSPWSSWIESCSEATCDVKVQFRVRDCINPVPQFGGLNCVGIAKEERKCSWQGCPVNGNWSQWTSWIGNCADVTCGVKEQFRVRDCNNPKPQFGGTNCVGATEEKQNCSLPGCPVNGNWSAWQNSSTCSVTCGVGHITQERFCNNPAPAGNGSQCVGNSTRSVSCDTGKNCPINGNLSAWSFWIGNCSEVTCGLKEQVRVRDCDNPKPQHGGTNCVGITEEKQNCSLPICPVDGNFTSWTSWIVNCSDVTCGVKEQVRVRDCTNPAPQFGGKNCVGVTEEKQNCSLPVCPVQNSRTQSTPLVTCSVTCGGGYEVLTTSCENQAPFKNGAPCYVEIKNVLCNTQPCPVNGAWGAWFNDGCTVTCGGGFLTKRRYCIDPLPANNGTQCKLNNGLFTTRRKLYEEVEEKCMETPCAN